MAQTNRQTDGHGDSMTDPAQRAESVKMYYLFFFSAVKFVLVLHILLIHWV